MKITSSQMKKIQNYFAKQTDILAVYLYGSFAKGTAHKRSDIDFGVLFNAPIKTYSRLGEIINDLSDLKLPGEPDVRNIDLDDSPVYLMNVIQGQLIYSRNEIKRTHFEVAVLSEFYDTQRLRDTKRFYTQKGLQEGTYGY